MIEPDPELVSYEGMPDFKSHYLDTLVLFVSFIFLVLILVKVIGYG